MVNSVRIPWVPKDVRGLQGAPECFTDVCVPHVSKNVDEQTIGVKSFRTGLVAILVSRCLWVMWLNISTTFGLLRLCKFCAGIDVQRFGRIRLWWLRVSKICAGKDVQHFRRNPVVMMCHFFSRSVGLMSFFVRGVLGYMCPKLSVCCACSWEPKCFAQSCCQ